MNKKLVALIAFGAAATFGAACSSTKTAGNPTGSGTPTATGTPETTTLIAIHTTHPTIGQLVTVKDLVVTAVDSFGDFWAQDATFTAGGLNEGGYFYNKNKGTPTGLAVGNIITVTGAWNPYSGPASDPWTGPFISFEIDPTSSGVVITNPSTTAPTPVNIPLGSLSEIACPASSALQIACPAQPYEALLVSITGATINTTGEGYDNYGISAAAGGLTAITVDNAIFDTFETARVGDTISFTGVVGNNFKAFHLEPRSASDITFTPVGNPNDLAHAMSYASINALLAAPPAYGQLVTLTGTMHVGAHSPYTNSKTSKTLTSFWGQDGTTGALSSGIYFDDSFYMIGTPATVGSNMTITGTVAKPISGKFLNTGVYSIAGAPACTTGVKPPLCVEGFDGASFEVLVGFPDMITAAGGSNYITGTAATAITPMSITCGGSGGIGYAGTGTTFQKYEGLVITCSDTNLVVVDVVNAYGDFDVGPGPLPQPTKDYWTIGNYNANFESMGTTAGTAIGSVTGVFNGNKGFQEIEPLAGGVTP